MIARLGNWLDHRTGYRKLMEVLLIEHIPGGAKWRYVWGSCLAAVFAVQLITGVLLMTAYSPGDSTAWASVYYIQYEMDFGWFIRGLHHFGSQTMVVLLGIHMLQVVIAGAHLPPREVNWWLGLGLLGMVLAMSLTGYLLPWDQKGYEATKVATNIMGNLPGAGPWLQKIVVGGPVYGHHTLTRFFTLHVAILPPLIVVFVIAHLSVFRRHGVTVSLVTVPTNEKGEPTASVEASARRAHVEASAQRANKADGWFWPDQAFRDMAVSMVVFGLMIVLVLWGHGHKVESPDGGLWDRVAHAGRHGLGANLDAPADLATEQYPARPEWYFLFLFQLLKLFEGEQEIVGTVIIPTLVGLLLFLLPLLGYGALRKFGHVFGVLVVSGLLVGAAVLTGMAIQADRNNEDFQKQQAEAESRARRAVQLADAGIPEQGPKYLLRRDPMTEGKKLFQKHCAVCHSYKGEFEQGKFIASDLANCGNEEWIRGLFREPRSPHYFGRTDLKTMSSWISRTRKAAEKEGPEAVKDLETDFDLIAKWLATHPTEVPKIKEGEEPSGLQKGFLAFDKRGCTECHSFAGQGMGTAPDLTGYGSPAWVRQMIIAPDLPSRYGDNNQMPAFRDLESHTAENTKSEYAAAAGKNLANLTINHLTDAERELIIRWLFKDDRVLFGGDAIAEQKRRQR